MGVSEDLERVALQERVLRLARLDAQVAWELGARLRTLAVERGLPVVIDVRRFGQPLFYAALEGTTPDNVEWVRRKSNVVARFHRSSYAVGLDLQKKNTNLTESQGLSLADLEGFRFVSGWARLWELCSLANRGDPTGRRLAGVGMLPPASPWC